MRQGGRRALTGVTTGVLALVLSGCVSPGPQPDDAGPDVSAEPSTSLTPWTPSPAPTWSPPADALWAAGTHLVKSPRGAFMAVVPRSWRSAPCPVEGTDCLNLSPAGAPKGSGLFVGGGGNGVEGNPLGVLCWLPGAPRLMDPGARPTRVAGFPGFRLDGRPGDGVEPRSAGKRDDVLRLACVPVPGAPSPPGPGSVVPVVVTCPALGSAAMRATCERVALTVVMPGLRVTARPGR